MRASARADVGRVHVKGWGRGSGRVEGDGGGEARGGGGKQWMLGDGAGLDSMRTTRGSRQEQYETSSLASRTMDMLR